MLNEFFVNYNKEDKMANVQENNDILFKKYNNVTPPLKLEGAHIPEFDRDFGEPKAHSIIKSSNNVFDNYDKQIKHKRFTSIDPFESLFGFKIKPVDKPLSSYYQYNVKNLGTNLNVALDRQKVIDGVQPVEGTEEDANASALIGPDPDGFFKTHLKSHLNSQNPSPSISRQSSEKSITENTNATSSVPRLDTLRSATSKTPPLSKSSSENNIQINSAVPLRSSPRFGFSSPSPSDTKKKPLK